MKNVKIVYQYMNVDKREFSPSGEKKREDGDEEDERVSKGLF